MYVRSHRGFTVSHRECGQSHTYVQEYFEKIQDNFHPDGQLDSITPEAPLTDRRGRSNVEFFTIFMNIGTELATLSMGYSM